MQEGLKNRRVVSPFFRSLEFMIDGNSFLYQYLNAHLCNALLQEYRRAKCVVREYSSVSLQRMVQLAKSMRVWLISLKEREISWGRIRLLCQCTLFEDGFQFLISFALPCGFDLMSFHILRGKHFEASHICV